MPSPIVLREPYNGIYYYADYSKAEIEFRRRKYKLWLWRETEQRAKVLVGKDKDKIVRRIEFVKGGMFKDVPGARKIYRYGVYKEAV